MVGVAKVRVFASGLWKSRRELREHEGAGERDRASHDPRGEHERSGRQTLGDDRGIDEDARADDSADDDHRGVEDTELAAKSHFGQRIPERRSAKLNPPG